MCATEDGFRWHRAESNFSSSLVSISDTPPSANWLGLLPVADPDWMSEAAPVNCFLAGARTAHAV
jgi:hypothetical protein